MELLIINYSKKLLPIIYSDLEIRLSYQDSGKSYVVQAADLLAGTIRRKSIDAFMKKEIIDEQLKEFVNIKIILP